MKILVFSDSHGRLNPMIKAANLENANMFIHLGDCVSDGNYLSSAFPNIPMVQVRGNNDFWAGCPLAEVFELANISIFATHGHEYGVKYGFDKIIRAAQSRKASIALFGHTHNPTVSFVDGIWLLNPGSISGIGTQLCTYGIIDFFDGKYDIYNKSL